MQINTSPFAPQFGLNPAMRGGCHCGSMQMAFMMQMMSQLLSMFAVSYQMSPGMLPPFQGMQRPTPLSNFLGSPQQLQGPRVPLSTPSNLQGNQGAVSTLMSSIRRSPVPPRCRPGYCYRGVKHHLRQMGVNLTGGSAYMAAGQLARSGRFREVRVPRSQLRSLPAGAVVVWNRGNGRRHGHISIAMGNGREASDRIRRQIVNYPNSFRVFIPR